MHGDPSAGWKLFVSRQRKRRDGVYGKYSRKRYIPHFRGGASRKGNHPSSAKRGKKLKKLYEKNELTFALLWIVVYCVLQSLANPLNKRLESNTRQVLLFASCRRSFLLPLSEKTICKSDTGFANRPFPLADFSTMCRCFSWHPGTFGTALRLIIHCQKPFAVLCVCYALVSWRK